MSAAEGFAVRRITSKDGAPLRRPWRVTLQLVGPPLVLGYALVRAETATEAANACRLGLPACTVFGVCEA